VDVVETDEVDSLGTRPVLELSPKERKLSLTEGQHSAIVPLDAVTTVSNLLARTTTPDVEVAEGAVAGEVVPAVAATVTAARALRQYCRNRYQT
jgi:hypothetical protein